MYRKAEKKIQEWIDHSKKALLIHGARQVGKTYLIREMLKRNEIDYCEYNLLERTDVLDYLNKETDAREISKRLAMYSDKPLTEGKSVIFLDEIQKYPDILTKIKFLVDEKRFRYVLSGSNLGVELAGIRSIPVGYADIWQMYPMTFSEFALASGISEMMIDHMQNCFKTETPLDGIVHEKLIKAFYYYLIVGGMPAVVNVYNETHNLESIDREQKSIINQLKADFIKYEEKNKRLKIIAVYDTIPAQLNKQNRKFVFKLLDKELKFDRYEESFLWLKDAAVAIPAYTVSNPVSPLEMSRETNVFKLYLGDVGLLTSCFPMSVKRELMDMNPDRDINNGSLFENYVAQELYAGGSNLFYYKKRSVGEVDFMIEGETGPIPIEVKFGAGYKRHAALDNLMRENGFEKCIVLSLNNTEKTERTTYLPIYMSELLADRTCDGETEMKPL